MFDMTKKTEMWAPQETSKCVHPSMAETVSDMINRLYFLAGNMKIKNSVKNQVGDIHWHRKLSGGCPSSLLFFDDMFTHSEYGCTDFVMLYTDALIYKRNVFAVGRILDTTIKEKRTV
uniref:Uncharacterized protein n=1 Tax=Glossina pallidipes TaxID=7398 RepID=A0A1B0A723_GLOPL